MQALWPPDSTVLLTWRPWIPAEMRPTAVRAAAVAVLVAPALAAPSVTAIDGISDNTAQSSLLKEGSCVSMPSLLPPSCLANPEPQVRRAIGIPPRQGRLPIIVGL